MRDKKREKERKKEKIEKLLLAYNETENIYEWEYSNVLYSVHEPTYTEKVAGVAVAKYIHREARHYFIG